MFFTFRVDLVANTHDIAKALDFFGVESKCVTVPQGKNMP
jgi:hypothetical protein